MNIKDSIRKINYKDYKLSKGWNDMTINLKNYMENENIDLFRVNEVKPHIFIWPEDSLQNKYQLQLLEKNKDHLTITVQWELNYIIIYNWIE
jgi:hypothetical protein